MVHLRLIVNVHLVSCRQCLIWDDTFPRVVERLDAQNTAEIDNECTLEVKTAVSKTEQDVDSQLAPSN